MLSKMDKQMDSVIESCGITTNLLIGILSCIEHNVEASIYCIDNKKENQWDCLPEFCDGLFTDISARLVMAEFLVEIEKQRRASWNSVYLVNIDGVPWDCGKIGSALEKNDSKRKFPFALWMNLDTFNSWS